MKKSILLAIMCMATLTGNAQIITLQNGQVFDSDVVITADKVILPKNGKVKVSNGVKLTIKTNELRVEGPFIFDGKGNTGANGGTPGDWTSSANPCWVAIVNKEVGHDDWEKAGGHDNDRGGDAGNGGPGATIYIEFNKLSGINGGIDLITFITEGGDPGQPGEGRKLICGCHNEHIKRGPTGKGASKGSNGSYEVVFSTKNEAKAKKLSRKG